jgi:murein DD-endopeptidase MepM/ murein hydrolase activator NlpD
MLKLSTLTTAAMISIGALLTTGAAAEARMTVKATPSIVVPGASTKISIRGALTTRCTLRVKNAGHVTLKRRVKRTYRLAVPGRSAAGTRTVVAQCGKRKAFARVTIAPADGHAELGPAPVGDGETDAFSLNKAVGGDFSTRIPLDRGRRVQVTQAAGGPYSHGTQYTRNAIDLSLPAGTTVRAGFSGVVAAARGGCAPSNSWGCGSGYGNFVYIKAPDNSCAIYAHLTALSVSLGQQVDRYTPVGTVGSSGSSTGPHLHTDRLNCSNNVSMPWAFEETGPVAENQFIVSGNEPPPAPAPVPPPAPAPTPSPSAPTRDITVDNRVTNGAGMREDSTPARLTTQPWTFCGTRGCNINGTERSSGQVYSAAVCQTTGERTTNGNDHDASDDANPERFESSRYYGVRLADGRFGYVSETWIRAADRGGLSLPAC